MFRPLDAKALLAAYDDGRPIDRAAIEPLSDLARGEALQDEAVALRIARGERPIGFKIGFTNHTIWPIYDVHAPIWAPVFDSTVRLLDAPTARIELGHWMQPRLEPEIVFGLGRSPAGPEPAQLLESIDWVAHGVEIVQSAFIDWKFSAAEAAAAFGLHAALLVGPRHRLGTMADPRNALASMSIRLESGHQAPIAGRGADVLGSPLAALGHLVEQLARRGRGLEAPAIVTTGTLTDAMPLFPGQRWSTRFDGIELDGLLLETV